MRTAFAHISDHAGLADPAPDSVSQFFQFVRDDSCRALDVEAGFGVHVEIAPPFDDFFG